MDTYGKIHATLHKQSVIDREARSEWIPENTSNQKIVQNAGPKQRAKTARVGTKMAPMGMNTHYSTKNCPLLLGDQLKQLTHYMLLPLFIEPSKYILFSLAIFHITHQSPSVKYILAGAADKILSNYKSGPVIATIQKNLQI